MSERERVRAQIRELVSLIGPLVDQVVLVGGATPATWDLGPVDIRQTEDIDLIVPGGYLDFHDFQMELRQRGFRDPPEGHMARLTRGDLEVDVVPVDGSLGENPWYAEAWDTARHDDSLGLRVVTPGLFIATKLQAFSNPERKWGRDHYASHDLEDVVRVLRGLPRALEEVRTKQSRAHRYARFELSKLARRPDALHILQAHMEPDEASQRTAEPLLDALLELPGPK